ncbi:MAG: hypothetical protein JNK15_21150 [Planctomycetes bacterium]|nr:hypothetical protein [Planctomycetota bacterium]
MTIFDRRSFLGSLFAASGFAAAPDWLMAAMAPQDPQGPDEPDRLPQLREAIQRAQANGKPLFVFVAPEHVVPDRYSRGQWCGAWLTHGGPSALHTVAMGELACASLAEVVKATGAKLPEGVPYFVVLDVAKVGERDAPPPKVTPIHLELESPPQAMNDRGEPQPEQIAAVTSLITAGLAKITTAVQDGMNRHGANVASVAKATMARLDDTQKAQLAKWLATGAGASPELVVRAAAEVRRGAADLDETNRKRVLDGLTAAIEQVVVKQRVPGSRWLATGGCGETYEDPTEAEKERASMIGCGMGVVPPLCERFLDLWAVRK